MWPIRTVVVVVEGEKTIICTMTFCITADIVKFAKRARITAALTSEGSSARREV
jgi:hypothetical protein